MIANKQKIKVFLKQLSKLLTESGADIHGNIAFFDPDAEKWSDWLELEASALRVRVKDIGPDEDQTTSNRVDKLEEMHNDMLALRVEVLELTSQVMGTIIKKTKAKKRPVKKTTRKDKT
jgi:hypothetical protein